MGNLISDDAPKVYKYIETGYDDITARYTRYDSGYFECFIMVKNLTKELSSYQLYELDDVAHCRRIIMPSRYSERPYHPFVRIFNACGNETWFKLPDYLYGDEQYALEIIQKVIEYIVSHVVRGD
jgi:hypothetical protein